MKGTIWLPSRMLASVLGVMKPRSWAMNYPSPAFKIVLSWEAELVLFASWDKAIGLGEVVMGAGGKCRAKGVEALPQSGCFLLFEEPS